MKKLFLTMGAMASVITPVVAVVSCGDDDNTNNAGATTTTVEATKATAAITAFVGAAGATTGTTAGGDITDLLTTDFNTEVTSTDSYAFTSAGKDMTGHGVTLTLKAEKTGGYKFAGASVSGAQYIDAGTKITIIAVAAPDDATDKFDKVYIEFKNSNGTAIQEINNETTNNQTWKNTLEAVIKATGYGATA